MQLNEISKRLSGEMDQHTWNTPACLIVVLARQVVSFHTIEALLIFCFIVSLELKFFFLVGDSLMLRRIPQLDRISPSRFLEIFVLSPGCVVS